MNLLVSNSVSINLSMNQFITGCCYDFVIKVGCIVKCFCCVVVLFCIAFEHLAVLGQ